MTNIRTWLKRMPARIPESTIDFAMVQITCMAAEIDELRAALVERVPLPDDLFSHKYAWLYALQAARDTALVDPPDINDRSYWVHEIKVFQRVYAALEASHGITAKPMFADLIATHEGLAEELRAVDNIKESQMELREMLELAALRDAIARAEGGAA
jgi:hypothetical protein